MSYFEQLIVQTGIDLPAPAPIAADASPPIVEIAAEEIAAPPSPPALSPMVTSLPVDPIAISRVISEAPAPHVKNDAQTVDEHPLRVAATFELPAPTGPPLMAPPEIVIAERVVETILSESSAEPQEHPPVPSHRLATSETPPQAPAPVEQPEAGHHRATPAAPPRRPTIIDVRRWVAMGAAPESPQDRGSSEVALDSSPALVEAPPRAVANRAPLEVASTVAPLDTHVDLSIGSVHVTVEAPQEVVTTPRPLTAPVPAPDPVPSWSRLARRYVRL